MYQALYGPKGLVIFDHPYNADSERLIAAAFQLHRVRRSSAYGSWQAVGSAFATSASTARPARALGVNAADQLQVLLRRPDQTGGQPLRRSRRDPAPARATSGRIACGSQLVQARVNP